MSEMWNLLTTFRPPQRLWRITACAGWCIVHVCTRWAMLSQGCCSAEPIGIILVYTAGYTNKKSPIDTCQKCCSGGTYHRICSAYAEVLLSSRLCTLFSSCYLSPQTSQHMGCYQSCAEELPTHTPTLMLTWTVMAPETASRCSSSPPL